MNRIKTILNKVNQKPKDKLQILSFVTHESYQTELAKTGHDFYFLHTQKSKPWDTRFRPMPSNCHVITSLLEDLKLDFILSQERFGQLQMALDLSRQTRLPVVHMEHVEPQLDRWSPEHFQNIQKLKGDLNVFITEHNKKSWGYGDDNDAVVIPHGIDTELFNGWNPNREKPYVLYVVNQLEGRDYFCGYKEWKAIKDAVQKEHPEIEFRLVGDNPGLGKPAKNIQDLVKQYQGCVAYLNTSKLSPVPMSLLEAMSVGCPVFSTAKQEIPNIVAPLDWNLDEGDHNGFCTNNIDDLIRAIIKYLSSDIEAQKQISILARETILHNFSSKQFIDDWNKIFTKAYNLELGKQFDNIQTI